MNVRSNWKNVNVKSTNSTRASEFSTRLCYKNMTYTNHSGGAKGSDSAWDFLGRKRGIDNHNHYWHPGLPKPPLGNVQITDEQLEEGWQKVLLANKTLKRRPEKYKSLLARNWFQVKNADAVFAIGTIYGAEVSGGTGWAVQMAIDSGKPVYVFDQAAKKWFVWKKTMFVDFTDGKNNVPQLTPNFAGIGTREISPDGIAAIEAVYDQAMGQTGNSL